MPVTGDKAQSRQTYAVVTDAALLTEAELGDINHAINDSNISGKKEGASVMCNSSTLSGVVLAVAQGGSNGSGWLLSDGATLITPA